MLTPVRFDSFKEMITKYNHVPWIWFNSSLSQDELLDGFTAHFSLTPKQLEKLANKQRIVLCEAEGTYQLYYLVTKGVIK